MLRKIFHAPPDCRCHTVRQKATLPRGRGSERGEKNEPRPRVAAPSASVVINQIQTRKQSEHTIFAGRTRKRPGDWADFQADPIPAALSACVSPTLQVGAAGVSQSIPAQTTPLCPCRFPDCRAGSRLPDPRTTPVPALPCSRSRPTPVGPVRPPSPSRAFRLR